MVTRLNAVFRALADPTRRRILERLRRGPAETGRIARDFPVSRPAISKHLRVLEGAGLVRGKRVGRRHVWASSAAPLRRVEEWLALHRDAAASDPETIAALAELDGDERPPAARSPRERSSPRPRRRKSSGR